MKKHVSHIAAAIFSLTVLYFFARITQYNWAHIRTYTFNFDISTLFAASGAYIATFFLLSLGLYLFLIYFRTPIPLIPTFLYFCITAPARYIPGKIWVAIARMKFFKNYNVPKSIVILSNGAETLMEILAGTYISLIAMFYIPAFSRFSVVGPITVALIGVVLMIPGVFYAIINLYLRLVRQPLLPKEGRASFFKLILLQLVYLVGMFGMGASQFLFLQSFAPVPASAAPSFISIGAFTYVASIVAIFTPSGLGVREGIWYLSLRKIATAPVALIYAFASRLWMIIIEAILLFICLPIALVLDRRRSGQNMPHIVADVPLAPEVQKDRGSL